MKINNKIQIFITLVFSGFVIWWLSFQHVVSAQGPSVNWFENTYGLVALFGSVIGFLAMKKYGGHRTVLGKSLLFFSLGLFAQEAGQLISSYYTQIAKTSLPYPSVGDIAYFGGVLLYICAAFYLAKLAGVKFSLKNMRHKVVAVVVPLALLLVSYLLLLHHYKFNTTHPITVLLDAGYPLGEVCYISIAVVAYLLSRKMLGGVMKTGVLLVILALCIQYVSDFTFVYQSHHNSYLPGKFDDLFYLISYFAMATAMIRFNSVHTQLRQNKGGT